MTKRRHTRKVIRWNNENWTFIRAKGRCKWIEGGEAQVNPEQKIIAFKARDHDREIKDICHELLHYITELGDSGEEELRVEQATDLLIDFFKAHGVDLSPLTEGFE
jgi:hypothetical protein